MTRRWSPNNARSGRFLTPTARKSALVLHVIFGIGWMGLDIALFILLLTGLRTADAETAMTCYRAVAIVAPVPLLVLSTGMLSSGRLLG